MRKRFPASIKLKVALEAVKGEKTIAEISGESGAHSNQVISWKKKLLEEAVDIFQDKRKKRKEQEPTSDELYQKIGQLEVECDWLKKKLKL